ncbi:hypothetical protein [Terasakiella sp. SH-1]|uniref:hypothetical protein n=1 Tax=Terasakiella sp. SH-1 TaxID=2560057 RepID=UPI0010739513|nr:hypothetical protein [Terasakiella sp. SH-1]
MKTLLIAFAFILATYNANAEEVRAGWIIAELEDKCMKQPGATSSFCGCAINKIFDAGYTDKQLEIYLGEFDDNQRHLIRKINEYFKATAKNSCASKRGFVHTKMYNVCSGSLADQMFEHDKFDLNTEQICNCRAEEGFELSITDILYDYFTSDRKQTFAGHEGLIAMLEGKDASVNKRCGGF